MWYLQWLLSRIFLLIKINKIEESIENVSEKSGSNNQFSRQKTTIEVHLKVVYILK